ncbi:M16 family metallopeptidase [Alteriqipengyuania lutimaris]|uniref:Insulinase family protein n=1 Tax=Alteriqipengyuania lutimaris TaxID=1538146 RepID=A0A395LKR2_9SPHN|nr:pitrilysin family protein [Alteriqipengyuania lutimaris]MBB3033462.1 putative Zn-dependent peptidase [Alteriqipengyuania lutimaris]RDS77522.1 insulinase family protein [Alteriqipengyuania lutimaris]
MIKTTKTSLAALAIALATPALVVTPVQAQGAAQAADAQDVAPLEDLVEQVAIPYQEFELENGLTVIVHEDRKAPIVGVAVWYNVGSKDEPQDQTGFAHLFEHLMFNGSENAPNDYFQYLQEMGATDYNGTTDFDRTNYFQTVPTGALERALWLESDRMGYLLGAVTQEKLDNQRGVVQNEKRQGDNQPGGLVFYEIVNTLYPDGHPYDHTPIGSMADLDAASLEDVQNWFRDNYGPNNATLVLAGDISAAEARPLVEKYFGSIARGPVNEPARAEVTVLEEDVRKVMQDQVAATSIDKYYSVPGITDRDLTALTVGANILGGLASSRLDNMLVRDEQLAVQVSAGNYAFQRVGILNIGAVVKPGVDAALVEQRLNEIIAEYIAEGPTEDEVRRAATSDLAGTIRGLEQVGGFGGKAVTLAQGEVLAGDPGFFERQFDILATLTPAEIKAAMQTWMTRPALTMVLEPGERTGEYEEAASVGGSEEGGDDAEPAASEITVTKTRPAPDLAPLTELDFPDVTQTTLSNGITVYYAQRDAVPATRVSISFDAGSAADPVDLRGVEGLTLSLMEEGTTSMSSREIAEAQERLGANISVGGGSDRSTFTLSALSANLDPSLDLMADIVRNPAFDANELERIRAQEITGIEQSLRTPQGLAYRALNPLVYGATNPYGGQATVETVQAITRDDLVEFQQTWLRPDNAQVFVVSDLALSEVLPGLEEAFGNWSAPATPVGEKDFSNMAEAPESSRIVLINRPNSPQSFILGGQITPASASDDTITDLVNANNALGGNFLARLNMNLRETKGWSYGVRGGVSIDENAVAYLVQAPVQADRTGDSLAELIREVDEFVTTSGVTDEELVRIVNNEIRQLPGQFETSGAVLGGIQNNVLYDRPMDYYETLADTYRAQTAQSLDDAARAAISADRFVWVVVGDAEQVRPQLERLGLPVETIEAE